MLKFQVTVGYKVWDEETGFKSTDAATAIEMPDARQGQALYDMILGILTDMGRKLGAIRRGNGG